MRRLMQGWWKPLAVLLLVGGFLGGLPLLGEHQQRMLKDGAGEIHMALERFAVDTEGSYPTEAQLLIERVYLREWPRSPYGGRMEPLHPEWPAKPGCFHYVPSGPIIAVPGKDGVPKMVMPWEVGTLPYRTEMDSYVLAVYGTRPNPKLAVAAKQSATRFRNRGLHGKDGSEHFTPFDLATSVDWSRVAIMITAGEDPRT